MMPQVMVLALMGFLSYLLALSFDLSAILAVFFCGITMSHYTWHALCPAAQSLSLHSFRIVSSAMEMVLYAYSGIDIWCTAMWQHGVYRSASAVRKVGVHWGWLLFQHGCHAAHTVGVELRYDAVHVSEHRQAWCGVKLDTPVKTHYQSLL